MDLLKIESRPIAGAPWQYRFYVDARASVSEPSFYEALAALERCAEDVRLFGCYRAAARHSQETTKEKLSWQEKTT